MPDPVTDPPRNPGDACIVAGGLLVAIGAGLCALPLGVAVLGVELVLVGLWWRP